MEQWSEVRDGGISAPEVLNDKTLSIDTNPVDIYKCWINQMETSTGQQSELPRVVSQEAALQHEEVQKRLALGISALKNKTLEFLERISSSRDQLPYSLLYTARTLHNALSKRFPGFPEKDLLKVIGNVVYYHFINAAIVAPDAYDIITLPAEKTLTVDERSNLASIAKILQYAASKKGFGEESSHLKELNPFIIECHEKFKKFLKHCCQVEELEEHFGVHAYTEATLIVKPTILISLQELLETHQLVLQYEDEIASSPVDPLHELLEGLGPISAVRKLLGGSSAENFMPKGELFLTLSNSKLEVASSNGNLVEPDQSQLFMMSKELLVSILPFLSGSDLHLALDSLETPAQEQQFAQQQLARHRGDQPAPSTSLRLSKMRLQLWLSQLERQGLVSAKDNYQALVSAVARDICTRGQYCQARSKELQTLKVTMQGLETKTKFYQKQVEFYNMYIRTCLENLDKGKKRVHRLRVSGKHPGKAKSQKVLRYSAAQLHAKGVLHQMRGLTPAQFKSVQFEISPTESVGVFEVKGCFMGIEMERADIDIQHLLQMQYEGQAIMDMFGKVQINVNLLLFLLNKKFYGKS